MHTAAQLLEHTPEIISHTWDAMLSAVSISTKSSSGLLVADAPVEYSMRMPTLPMQIGLTVDEDDDPLAPVKHRQGDFIQDFIVLCVPQASPTHESLTVLSSLCGILHLRQ